MFTLGVALVLVLRTYDMAGVPPRELAGAERAAAAVLARARIELSWISCLHAGVATHDWRCDQAHLPSELIVRMIAAPPQSTNAALADANVDIDAAFGSFATLYVDRVRSLAAAGGIDPGTLMGRAIAHEVGHLLSGTSSHSPTGLMRAVWSTPMLRKSGEWAWMFSEAEAVRLRTKLGERIALASAAQADLIESLPPARPCQRVRGLVCADSAVPASVRLDRQERPAPK